MTLRVGRRLPLAAHRRFGITRRSVHPLLLPWSSVPLNDVPVTRLVVTMRVIRDIMEALVMVVRFAAVYPIVGLGK